MRKGLIFLLALALVPAAAGAGDARRFETHCYHWHDAAPGDASDHLLARLNYLFTVTGIWVAIEGSTSIPITLKECLADLSACSQTVEAAITADADGAAFSGAIDAPTIEAGNWLRIEYGAPTGSPSSAAGVVCGIWSLVQ